MKLLRMTATFGRLEQETLSLTEGLNVLQMPNEAGKSTWAEFLLAMLYGIDTSEREKTGVLPVKTKYQPWSGKPMEGVIELEHAGRRITLTRTSTARAPLGVFSAVYTDSGLPVEGMTGANCGETLLGVPKRVYQRSAFVRQAGLGLTPDDELEARLSALVTTGDEAVSFAAADKRLLAGTTRPASSPTPSGSLPPLTARWPRWRGSMKKIWRCARSCSRCKRSRLPAKRTCGRCRRRRPSERRRSSMTRSAPRCRRQTGKTPRPPYARGSRVRTRWPCFRRRRLLCLPCRSRSLPHPRPRAPIARRRFPGWTRNGFSTRRSAICANLTG